MEGQDQVLGGQPAEAQATDQPGFEGWVQNVPKTLVRDDMRGVKSIGDYLQKTWQERDQFAEKVKGYEGYVKPIGEKATQEEIAAWRKAVGVPEAPDKYGVDGLGPEGQEFLQLAHQMNMTPAQVQKVIEFDKQLLQKTTEAQKAERAKASEAALSAIKAKYPTDWEQRITDANNVLASRLGETGMVELGGSQLANNPAFIEFVIEASKYFKSGPGGVGAPVPEQADSSDYLAWFRAQITKKL